MNTPPASNRRPRHPDSRWLAGMAVLAAATVAVAVVGRLHGLMVEDDAFIFVRYARNILVHGATSWNPQGPPTYGITSPLYLLIVVLARACVGDAPATAAVLGSLVSGLGCAVLLALLLRRYALPRQGLGRAAAVLFVLLPCAWAAASLSAHFATGMDTMFALLYVALLVLLAERDAEQATARRGVALALAAGLAFAARPDLVVYAFPLVAAPWLVASAGAARSRARRLVLASASITAALCALTWAYFGTPLPLTFFVKSVVRYGEDLEAAYRPVPWRELSRYLRSYSMLFVPIVVLLARDARRRQWSFTAVESACLVGTAIFTLYYLCFVLQVTPHFQRFYYPTLPAIVFLACRCAVRVVQGAGAERWRWTARLGRPGVGPVLVRGAVAVLIAASLVPQWRQALPRLAAARPFFALAAVEDQHGALRKHWFRLEELSTLPDDVVLAATEIGLLGVLHPEKTIIDLSGLNDWKFARHGFDAGDLLARRPDLIYMPHPDYRNMTQAILAHPAFSREYEYFPAITLGTRLAVALRRSSPRYAEMRAVVFGKAPPFPAAGTAAPVPGPALHREESPAPRQR